MYGMRLRLRIARARPDRQRGRIAGRRASAPPIFRVGREAARSPVPASWSALEYGCHVRDVLRFQRDRVALAQAEDTPEFVSMRRDDRVLEERYNEQYPTVVAAEIVTAAR